jgi:hypothetical protein
MSGHDPFDATRDVALGRLLREHLSAGDDARFVARMRAALAGERDSSWEVLSRWARPGLVAAASVVIGLGIWLSTQRVTDVPTLADAIQPSGAPTRVLAGAQDTRSDVVLVSWMEEQ